MSKLSRKIAKQTKVSESVVRIVLNGMTDCMAEELKETGEVSIPALGNVKLVENESRRFRNVATGKIDSKSQMRLTLSLYDSFKKRMGWKKGHMNIILEEGTEIFFIATEDGKKFFVDKGSYIPGVTEESLGILGAGFFLTNEEALSAMPD